MRSFYGQTLGEQKIASMVKRKDFRKGIIKLEWDQKMMMMQTEDLNNKMRDIQKLRLTEEQQEVSIFNFFSGTRQSFTLQPNAGCIVNRFYTVHNCDIVVICQKFSKTFKICLEWQ